MPDRGDNRREPAEDKPAVWSNGITLAILAAVCTALVAITWYLTAPRIAENEKAELERSLKPTLSDVFYDSDLTELKLVVPAPNDLPGDGAATVYRVYSNDAPVAAVFVVSARDGYAGPIKLLIGVEYSGEVTGVRVLEHHETPGLGDLIEASKSDWLKQFERSSLDAPTRSRWAIKRDGGDFDQITGASITARAVVGAVKETLLYFESHRDAIFQAKTGTAAAGESDQ